MHADDQSLLPRNIVIWAHYSREWHGRLASGVRRIGIRWERLANTSDQCAPFADEAIDLVVPARGEPSEDRVGRVGIENTLGHEHRLKLFRCIGVEQCLNSLEDRTLGFKSRAHDLERLATLVHTFGDTRLPTGSGPVSPGSQRRVGGGFKQLRVLVDDCRQRLAGMATQEREGQLIERIFLGAGADAAGWPGGGCSMGSCGEERRSSRMSAAPLNPCPASSSPCL